MCGVVFVAFFALEVLATSIRPDKRIATVIGNAMEEKAPDMDAPRYPSKTVTAREKEPQEMVLETSVAFPVEDQVALGVAGDELIRGGREITF